MIPASSVLTSTHWSNSTSCVSEKQNPGTARQHPVHTSKRPRHNTHTAPVVFIESVDAQSFIAIVSKSHPVDPQTPQLVDLGSKLSRTAQWPACKTLPWMKTRGQKKQKKDLCSRAEPSRAAERRKRFRAVCLLLCSFLWGVVLIRRLRTNCTRSDDPVLQHESVKDDVNVICGLWQEQVLCHIQPSSSSHLEHRLTQKHSEGSETTPPAVTERFCWFCSGFWTLKTPFCWTLLFFVNLICDETTKQILLTGFVTKTLNRLWDYATWKQDEINHVGFILIDVVISVWFWIGSDSDSSYSLTNTLKIMIMWRLLESVANVSSHLSSFHPVRSHFSPFIQKIKASAILELVLVLILRFWLYFY